MNNSHFTYILNPTRIETAVKMALGMFNFPLEVVSVEVAWYLTGGSVASAYNVGVWRGNVLSHSREYDSCSDWIDDTL